MNTSKDIKVGDKYFNPKSPHLGVRVATEQTLKNIEFANAFSFNNCYYQKVN